MGESVVSYEHWRLAIGDWRWAKVAQGWRKDSEKNESMQPYTFLETHIHKWLVEYLVVASICEHRYWLVLGREGPSMSRLVCD